MSVEKVPPGNSCLTITPQTWNFQAKSSEINMKLKKRKLSQMQLAAAAAAAGSSVAVTVIATVCAEVALIAGAEAATARTD